MNKKKCDKNRFGNSNTLPIHRTNSLDKTKNISRKKLKIAILEKKHVPKNKNSKFIETQKYFSPNSKRMTSNQKKEISNLNKNTNRNKHTYHTIIYSNANKEHIQRFANSVNRPITNNNCSTPKKHISSNIINRNQKHTLIHQRCNTLNNIKKNNIEVKNKCENEKKIPKRDIKVNILFKKLKTQKKIPNERINLRYQTNEKNKNNTEKIKKFEKAKIERVKIDLNLINGIQSKEERMHNLLYGISYMTEKKKCELCHKMVDSYLYKFHYYSHPSPIFNWIYLGTSKNANNIEEIKNLDIKYILNCAVEIKVIKLPNYIKYCQLNITDSSTTNIIQFFEQAFAFIELARRNKEKILIHCKLGISRSPSILIGYLIKYMGYTTESALDFLRSIRTQVYPNPGFISQIYLYERNIKKNQKKIANSSISNSTADFSLSK